MFEVLSGQTAEERGRAGRLSGVEGMGEESEKPGGWKCRRRAESGEGPEEAGRIPGWVAWERGRAPRSPTGHPPRSASLREIEAAETPHCAPVPAGSARAPHPEAPSRGRRSPGSLARQGWVGWAHFAGGVGRRGGDSATRGLPEHCGPGPGWGQGQLPSADASPALCALLLSRWRPNAKCISAGPEPPSRCAGADPHVEPGSQAWCGTSCAPRFLRADGCERQTSARSWGSRPPRSPDPPGVSLGADLWPAASLPSPEGPSRSVLPRRKLPTPRSCCGEGGNTEQHPWSRPRRPRSTPGPAVSPPHHPVGAGV